MKIVHIRSQKDGQQFGVLANCGQLVHLMPDALDLETALDLAGNVEEFVETVKLSEVELLSPVPNPQKIICVGKNYADHAREMGDEPPELPVIFNKFPTALNHPGGTIALPEISDAVDFEAELVVVIGTGGKEIPRANALAHIAGFCCGNDISARDWQKGKPGGQWLLGKSFDGFAPIGPWLVTPDEVDFENLAIELRLNGNIMQQSNTSHLIFPVDFLIAHISKFFELVPGDLLFTGTPAGVGAGRTPPLFLKTGDELAVEISGLGVLENTMVPSSAV